MEFSSSPNLISLVQSHHFQFGPQTGFPDQQRNSRCFALLAQQDEHFRMFGFSFLSQSELVYSICFICCAILRRSEHGQRSFHCPGLPAVTGMRSHAQEQPVLLPGVLVSEWGESASGVKNL
ncbi:hypothetical protein [Aquitalea magnusonii]|uniref:hypothetical protein n=1 Tax=Aquitalea magnusonii TaxID=332411 RepID=UPI00128ED270|nr:hypothetical protein [Aquitalea magnusonii]